MTTPLSLSSFRGEQSRGDFWANFNREWWRIHWLIKDTRRELERDQRLRTYAQEHPDER